MKILKVLPEFMTQNIMIRDNTSRKVKRYLPKTFSELIDYAKSDKWEFGHDKIDLYFLEYNSSYKETESDSFEKTMQLKPVKYNISTSSENWNVYRVQFTHTDESVIYLPGHYKVIVVDDNGSFNTLKRIDELTLNDRVLCRVLDNVIISQSLFSIENKGIYSMQMLIELEIDENEFLPVGNAVLQVLVND